MTTDYAPSYSDDNYPSKPTSDGTTDINDGEKERQAFAKQLVLRIVVFIAIGLGSLMLSLSLARQVLGIELPHTLEDIQSIADHLATLSNAAWSDTLAVAGVFAVLYLWQQAFSIPGSVLFNLLAGHLYGIATGTILTSLLTAAGATLAYGLSLLVAEPFLQLDWVSRRAASMTRQINGSSSSKSGLFWWLLFARLFPFSPYW